MGKSNDFNVRDDASATLDSIEISPIRIPLSMGERGDSSANSILRIVEFGSAFTNTNAYDVQSLVFSP